VYLVSVVCDVTVVFQTNVLAKFVDIISVFFKENVRYPVWTCRDPISVILGAR